MILSLGYGDIAFQLLLQNAGYPCDDMLQPRLNCSRKILHMEQNVKCSPYLMR